MKTQALNGTQSTPTTTNRPCAPPPAEPFFGNPLVAVARPEHAPRWRTQEHLLRALREEAFVYAKYRLYAQYAQARGHPAVADLFARAAQTELLRHLAAEAALAGLVGDDAANLRDALGGFPAEMDALYGQFADEARADGDAFAAAEFTALRTDARRGQDAFAAALARVEASGAPHVVTTE